MLIAFQAGLIPTEDSDRLVIVLEPEAASIFCRQLNIHNFVGVPEESMGTKFRSGEKFLVIDAGGENIQCKDKRTTTVCFVFVYLGLYSCE